MTLFIIIATIAFITGAYFIISEMIKMPKKHLEAVKVYGNAGWVEVYESETSRYLYFAGISMLVSGAILLFGFDGIRNIIASENGRITTLIFEIAGLILVYQGVRLRNFADDRKTLEGVPADLDSIPNTAKDFVNMILRSSKFL